MRKLTIATRKSPLALWQAHHVSALLRGKGVEVALLEMTTAGDRFLQAPLAAVGGKGLFVKEIEQSLLEHRADVAVHSLKDMTSEMPAGLTLACVPDREDPRDAFVGRKVKTLAELPKGARVGTSSLRRASQLLEKRPDLEIVPLRGNVQSRLRKTEELDLHGTILAYAGLKRLELDAHATEVIAPETSLPAVGQGALGIQCRTDDPEVLEVLRSLQHRETRIAVTAERAFLEVLQGGCTVPLAGYAVIEGATLRLRGLVGSPDGKRVVRGERRGPVDSAVELGRSLADEILAKGGREILDANAHTPKPPPVEMT